jgi:hypothetical protein
MAVVGIAAQAGCERPPGTEASDAVAIALTSPAGVVIAEVRWTVLSSSDQIVASGTIDASGPGASVSFGIGLPPGADDLVQMTATTAEGATCTGASERFDVLGSSTLSVAVALLCSYLVVDAGAGSITVTGTLIPGDSCPTIDHWSISSAEAVSGGAAIAVAVSAIDPDADDVLTYAWSVDTGTFTAPTAASTEYECGPPGTETLSVRISDNHAPTPCVLSVSFPPVTCS